MNPRVAGLFLFAAVAACGTRTRPLDDFADASVEAAPAPPVCGNGIVEPGELCDDGNSDDVDRCTNRCGPTSCGDGVVQTGEQCDDGNTDDTDGCLSSCAKASCGDGKVQAGVEECDDGNGLSTDACVACRKARCGDGFVQAGVEPCDDGNANDDDECGNACKLPVCGDGKKQGKEECDLGADNGDKPAFLVTQPSGTSIGTNPIYRNKSATLFYDYRSASSHTGLEQVGESRIYLYVDTTTGRLSLVLTHGIDFDSSGLTQPKAQVDFDVAGIPPGFTIDVRDDTPGEFFATSASTASGRWSFDRNSDGGVLGGLPFPGVWKVTVTPKFLTGLTTWGFVRDDLARIPLVMKETITIEAFDQSSRCRKTCTIPRCGDKILDGGEVCDDGNNVSGDGCAADCKSTR
ncbi:MAG: DUF4215 domain-containing protein [Myxococcales bacterium]|nr:DUF4215 domain-containing protein [Myxococcales bacterium]